MFVALKGRFPSGQRGQTVNLLAQPSKVRILLSPYLPIPMLPSIVTCFQFFNHASRRAESGPRERRLSGSGPRDIYYR